MKVQMSVDRFYCDTAGDTISKKEDLIIKIAPTERFDTSIASTAPTERFDTSIARRAMKPIM